MHKANGETLLQPGQSDSELGATIQSQVKIKCQYLR